MAVKVKRVKDKDGNWASPFDLQERQRYLKIREQSKRDWIYLGWMAVMICIAAIIIIIYYA